MCSTALRSFPRPLRLVALVFTLVFVVSACSGSSENAGPDADSGLNDRTDAENTTTTSESSTSTVPDAIAFIDEAVTLRVGVPNLEFVEPHDIDETDPIAVLVTDVLTDGLTQIDSTTGLAEPALADTWRVSGDRLTWTFALGGHVFSNGEQITADDVVASLNRIAGQGVSSLSGPSLWAVEGWLEAGDPESAVTTVSGISAVSEDEVEITLTTPFADLAEVLGGVIFGVVPADDTRPDVGAGEFPLTSSAVYQPVALWEDGIRMQGEEVPGEISAIELYWDPEGSLLAAGEVDLGVGLDPEQPLPGIEHSQSDRGVHVFFAMDASEAPLDDPLVRQAILHSIDREAIRDEFFPNLAVMDGFAPSGHDGAETTDACAAACEVDLDEARLLVEASSNRDVPLTVDFFLDGSPQEAAEDGADELDEDEASAEVSAEAQLATAIAEALQETGLDATAVGHDPLEYGTLAANGELGLFRFGTVSTSPSRESDLAAMFGSDGPDNITGISIDRLDEVLVDARQELDGAQRQLDYAEAESIVFGEAALAPLVTLRHDLWFGENLSSAGLEPDGSLDLAAMTVVLDQFSDDE